MPMADVTPTQKNDMRLKEETLIPYGFRLEEGHYVYSKSIRNGEFSLDVLVEKDGTIDTRLTDLETGDPYVLYKFPTVHGEYVGAIRDEIHEIVKDIEEHCFTQGYHTSEECFFLLDYCMNTYGEEPEYLWHDENCILRRKDNKKWYAVLMRVNLRKVGLEEDRVSSLLAVRGNPDEIDMRMLFRGYHLNQKSWVSMVLDGRTSFEEIAHRIDQSRELALGKKK